MTYYIHHTDTDAHQCVSVGVSSVQTSDCMNYYTHHSDKAAHHCVSIHIPDKEMTTNITEILKENTKTLKTNY
jgi:hypothetical protein